jgi:hypothetical protein
VVRDRPPSQRTSVAYPESLSGYRESTTIIATVFA